MLRSAYLVPLAASLLALLPLAAPVAAAPRNVVLIVADDQSSTPAATATR